MYIYTAFIKENNWKFFCSIIKITYFLLRKIFIEVVSCMKLVSVEVPARWTRYSTNLPGYERNFETAVIEL